MSMRIEDDGTLVLRLTGELDHHMAKHLREELDERISSLTPPLVVLDFSGLSFMDSSGIGFILGRYKLCSELGIRLVLRGISPSLRRVFRLAGISRLRIDVEGGLNDEDS